MKSIQAKLTITILTIFFVSLNILAGLNYWKAREIVVEDTAASLTKLTIASSEQIALWLNGRKAELQILASNPVIKTGNIEAIIPILANAKKANPVYETIGFIDTTGTWYDQDGATGSVREREYFKQAMNGETVISNPVAAKNTGNLVAIVVVPVKDKERVVGIMFGPINIEDITKRVAAIKVGQTGYAYVSQGDGLVIFHPDKDIAQKYNPLKDTNNKFSPELITSIESMTRRETGLTRYKHNGVDRYTAYAPIAGTSWSIAITVPVSEIVTQINKLNIMTFIVALVVLIIVAVIVIWYARKMAKPIQDLDEIANKIADGDLTLSHVDIISNDEIGHLARSFEKMTNNLRELMKKVASATDQVAASSEKLTANAEQSAQAANLVATAISQAALGTENQAIAVDKAVALVEEITVVSRQGAKDANNVSAISEHAVHVASAGNASIKSAVTQMGQIQLAVDESAKVVTDLGEHSKKIGLIIATISGIAGQTNLLALNAAIEAARAGEQGRGFAVVAEEVRKLAEQSQEAAKQITNLIGDIQSKTERAVGAMSNGISEVHKGIEAVNGAGNSFCEIELKVKEVHTIASGTATGLGQLANISNQVLVATIEIDSASKDIASQAQNISGATEEQSASMQEIASSSQALAILASDLQNAVHSFKI